MKKHIIYIIMYVLTLNLYAQGSVTLLLADGIANTSIKNKMEKSVSALLTEINRAQSEKRALKLSPFKLSSSVQTSLSMLWENSPFYCTDAEITEHCITTGSGYQIRNIPLIMTPTDGSMEQEYQEAVVNFSKNGEIESFRIAISLNLYMDVVKSNLDMTDLRRRQLILDYVEQFRTSYNQKDMKFLQQVFSDDALIITGKVVKQKTGDGLPLPDKITYNEQSKKQYLTKLQSVFNANKQIKVTFDEVEVMRHPAKTDFYGVTLHQSYSSDRYHDEGYVFILWDFTDEAKPQIHVRTWQPSMFNGKQLDKDDVFSLSDFSI